jgi:hypothetical protein
MAEDEADEAKSPVDNGTDGTREHCLTTYYSMEVAMGFGKGALLWLIGIPLPIILLIAIFMHH